MSKKILNKNLFVTLLTVSMVFGAVGCGGQVQPESSDTTRKETKSIQAENQADNTKTDSAVPKKNLEGEDKTSKNKRTEYPLTVTTYEGNGTELTTVYQKAPEKVLAVYQGSIEIMLALGLEDKMVAAAGLDNEVPDEMKAAFSKVQYLDEFTPSKETVTMLEPDLILSWGSLFNEKNIGFAKEWVKKEVNTYINTNTRAAQTDADKKARTLENEFQDILNLGMIFDVQDQAELLVEKMKQIISDTTEYTQKLEQQPTALVLEFFPENITNYGSHDLAGDMLTKLGAVLANPDAASLGKEDLIQANPDVIFVVYMPYAGDDPEKLKQESLERITGDEALASLKAVKNQRVVPIMLSEMYASSTRTMDGIITFAQGLYPELKIAE